MTITLESHISEPGYIRRDGVGDGANVSQEAVHAQRMDALRKGNEVRVLNAQLKRDLGELKTMEARNVAGHVLLTDRERFGALQLGALLKAIRGWGPEKTRRLCLKAKVSERCRLEDLSMAQAKRVAELLGQRQSCAGKGGDE